jgi:hypothetical protein
MTPQEFVAKWKHVNQKESSTAQQHFLDLCALIGHPTPALYLHRLRGLIAVLSSHLRCWYVY